MHEAVFRPRFAFDSFVILGQLDALACAWHDRLMSARSALSQAKSTLAMALRSRRTPKRVAPMPKLAGPLGHLDFMRDDPLAFFLRVRDEVGDVARFRLGWMTAHLVSRPEDVKHVLVDEHRRYDKQTRGFDELRTILGNGLVTSEGELWRRQRRIAQPGFLRERVASLAPRMIAAAADLRARWLTLAERGETTDVAADMMRLTLRIASETLLSTNVSGDAEVVGEAVALLLHEANDRLTSASLPLSVPTPQNLRVRRAMEALDKVVLRAIDERRKSERPPDDLLTMLATARDAETGETMSDRQLRDEVMTMFLAGHETTANALAWTLYRLSLHPEARAVVHRELDRVLEGRLPSAADLPRLSSTTAVIKESMRLHPPVWIIGRRATEDDRIGEYVIPANSIVFVSPWVTHRHPSLWPNPEGFDPARFMPERAASIPRFAYFPFGAGPRICIGAAFAMMEAELCLATLLPGLALDLVSSHAVRGQPSITLRPRDGIRMRVSALAKP